MGHWDYTNVGASTTAENKKYVEKIFEYIGYAPKPEYSPDGDECSFRKPEVFCCEDSACEKYSGNIKKVFGRFKTQDLINILNALFPNTTVYEHYAVGNNTSDTWENHCYVYDPEDMTCYVDEKYTSYGGDGPRGTKSWEERFAIGLPKDHHIQALIDLSTKDGNEELTALLLELTKKIKEGLIVYKENKKDKRKIGEPYDLVEKMGDSWDEDEDEEEYEDGDGEDE